MDMPSSPLILLLPFAGAVAMSLTIVAWNRRGAAGAVPLAVLGLAVTVWTLGYALELGSGVQATKVFWAKVEYLGIVTVPTAWLAVTLQYTGRGHWLTRRRLGLLAIVPVGVLALVWTNDAHGLIWSDIKLTTVGSMLVLDLAHGPAFWANTLYSYGLLLLGAMILADSLLHSPRIYWEQSASLMISVLAPWVASLMFTAGVSPLNLIDPTPFAFIVSSVALGWALLRTRLLEAAPIARAMVFENVADGVLVLDELGCVADANPSALEIIGASSESCIGRPIIDVWREGPALLRTRDAASPHVGVSWSHNDGRYFDVTVIPLHTGGGRPVGRLVLLHDVTERQLTEETLRRSDRELRELSSKAIASQEQEREWIAVELHDRVAQVISALSFQLQALPADSPLHQPGKPVERAVALAELAIIETRQIMNDLYPTTLEDLGITSLLEEQLRQLELEMGCETSFEIDRLPKLPQAVEVTLYRVSSEALANVRRHSRARTVKVRLGYSDSSVVLAIEDDGVGFDAGDLSMFKRVGGILSMRQRVALMGGVLQVRSTANRGTSVTLQIPVKSSKKQLASQRPGRFGAN